MISESKKTYPRGVRFPEQLEAEIVNAAATRGTSINAAIIESIKLGLPLFERETPQKFVPIEQVKEMQPEAVAA